MNIIKTEKLGSDQYYQTVHTKNQIVLHHTVSSIYSSALSWWNKTAAHVGTAYLVCKNGNIYEAFDPKYWAYHIGKGSKSSHNKQSIGIEIVNEGPLVKKDDSKFYWFDGKGLYRGEVLEYNWRGHKYWARYTNKQFSAIAELLTYLTDKFDISTKIITNKLYNKDYLDFNGIVSHHNLRSDKTDVSPSLSLNTLDMILNHKINADDIKIKGLQRG